LPPLQWAATSAFRLILSFLQLAVSSPYLAFSIASGPPLVKNIRLSQFDHVQSGTHIRGAGWAGLPVVERTDAAVRNTHTAVAYSCRLPQAYSSCSHSLQLALKQPCLPACLPGACTFYTHHATWKCSADTLHPPLFCALYDRHSITASTLLVGWQRGYPSGL